MPKKSTTKKTTKKPKCKAAEIKFNIGMKVETITERTFPGVGVFPAGTKGKIIAVDGDVLTIELYENANIQLKKSEVFIVR